MDAFALSYFSPSAIRQAARPATHGHSASHVAAYHQAQETRHALWPVLSADTEFQVRIGKSMGEGMGRTLKPYARIMALGYLAMGAAALAHTARHWNR